MSYRMGSDPDPRRRAEFLEAIEPCLFSGDERGGTTTLRRAKIDQLIQIVVAAGQAQDRPAYQDITHGADRQPIGFSSRINIVNRRSTRGTLLVLDNDSGFPRDIFFQVRDQGAGLQIAVTARRSTAENRQGLPLIISSLPPG